ncbi:MAG TPA: hypothetical protein VN285_11495 [Candidatus Deferrimicrobium sp.]|nr:hypothetical protein [Candidatus Deferrimicrobium sp.]
MDDMRPTFAPVEGDNARKDPVRLLVVQGEARPAVDATVEPMVMTVPHLLLREVIAFLALSLFLVVISLVFNAPLEELASAERTPNPSKAPWYFLGLQELLHYYPPVVAGVILPGAVIFSLIIVPYFNLNLKRAPLWSEPVGRRPLALVLAIAVVSTIFLLTGKHPVWPLAASTWLIGALALAGLLPRGIPFVGRWASGKSLSFWIFSWFLIAITVLTVIGTLFRGPGWGFTVPWRDGIY